MPVCSLPKRKFCKSKQDIRMGNVLRAGEVPEYYLIVWDAKGIVEAVISCLTKRQLYEDFSELLICLKC